MAIKTTINIMAKKTSTIKCEMSNLTELTISLRFSIGGKDLPAAAPGTPPLRNAATVIQVSTADKKEYDYWKQFIPGTEYKLTIE